MGFVQVIDFRTAKIEEMRKLAGDPVCRQKARQSPLRMTFIRKYLDS